MVEMKGYLQSHRKTIILLIVGIFLCGITSTFTVPYVFNRWDADRSISVFRVSFGVILGITGAVILALLVREKLKGKEKWIRKALLLVLLYFLLQIIAGALWGSIGLVSYQRLGMNYENSKTIMDICIAVWQNLIRVFVT